MVEIWWIFEGGGSKYEDLVVHGWKWCMAGEH
jgi:hypothetical protein